MQWDLLHGDAVTMLKSVPSQSIQVCVTSPPYWQLRDYKTPGQIGLEASLEEYVSRIVAVFREVKRCLHDTGTLWLNIADTYAGGGRGGSAMSDHCGKGLKVVGPAGTLCNVPHKLCDALKADGWYHRSTMILAKPAPMPESVSSWRWERCRVKMASGQQYRHASDREDHGHPQTTYLKATWQNCPGCVKCRDSDNLVLRKGSWRPTRSYEFLFLFAKSPHYFCDGERVRTPLAAATRSRDQYSRILSDPDEQFAVRHDHETIGNPGGANLRDVIRWKAEPLKIKHYAAFPSFIPELAIKAGTSEKGNCAKCGMPVVRVVERKFYGAWHDHNNNGERGQRITVEYAGKRDAGAPHDVPYEPPKTTGWRPTCGCGIEIVPPVVLDPFVGTGTTIIAALRNGCKAIGIELSEEYVKLAKERINGAIHNDEKRPGLPFSQAAA